MRVLGLDIEPGKSPQASSQPTYSVVVIDEKKILLKEESVKLSKLIRLAWELRPNLIALDNVFELGSNEREVVKVLSLLPPEVKLVQVNLNQGKFDDLVEVARRYSIDVQGKPRPTKTALINAILALKGVGTVINAYESKTKIVISKGRTTSKGGMSSNRYKRNVRATVLRVARKIKEALDNNGFDYDYVVKRSKAGVEKAVFIVYAPRESLYGLVRKVSTQSVKVDLKPVYKSKLIFQDERKSERLLIVGVDPGIETGISIIDVNGNPVYFTSRRSMDRLDVIEIIRKFGNPVIIATDVNPPSDTVRKLASQLGGVKLFYPEKSLTVEEKAQMVQEYANEHGLKIDDPHVRDSLAAALKAFREISRKLRQAESTLRKLDIDIDEDSVISCIISGRTVADCVEEQIEKSLEKTATEAKDIKKVGGPVEYRPPVELIRELEQLKAKVKALAREKAELEEKLTELKTFYKVEVLKDRKVYELSERVKFLRSKLHDLEKALDRETQERSKLESLVQEVLSGRKVLIRPGQPGVIEIKDGKAFALGEEISTRIFDYFGREIAIVDVSVLKDLEVLKVELEREMLNKKGIQTSDLVKMFEEYRKKRWAS